jgi:hypothetical protein
MRRPASAKPPYAVPWMVYPAFFGGAPAVALLAALNGPRLGASRARQILVYAGCLAILVVRLIVVAWLGPGSVYHAVLNGAAGLLGWAVVHAAHGTLFRLHLMRHNGSTSSMVVPGIIAVLAGNAIEAALTYGLVRS